MKRNSNRDPLAFYGVQWSRESHSCTRFSDDDGLHLFSFLDWWNCNKLFFITETFYFPRINVIITSEPECRVTFCDAAWHVTTLRSLSVMVDLLQWHSWPVLLSAGAARSWILIVTRDCDKYVVSKYWDGELRWSVNPFCDDSGSLF